MTTKTAKEKLDALKSDPNYKLYWDNSGDGLFTPNLKFCRMIRGMSQPELVDALMEEDYQYTIYAISRWENQNRKCPPDLLYLISKILRVPVYVITNPELTTAEIMSILGES